ncbi:unnamed protein product [Cylindrotheca closterium]|uniref:Uncharacterized protein n=1 Tax=Cylindrotheca closterium TaxID=2856 RepID=A0AAD2CDS3_9STRA|nr:unnamed protein product [Cylindrotheca closterium]
MIVDYSFGGPNNKKMKPAGEGAVEFSMAPLPIRNALMIANPDYGPVSMFKNNMLNGFCHIQLSTPGAIKLEVIFLALPLVLPMSWTESLGSVLSWKLSLT